MKWNAADIHGGAIDPEEFDGVDEADEPAKPARSNQAEAIADRLGVTALIDLSEAEIAEKYLAGNISDDEFEDAIATKDFIKNKGFLGMEVDNAKRLHAQGILNDDQYDAFLEHIISPGLFYVKDITKGVAKGIENAITSGLEFLLNAPDAARLMHSEAEFTPEEGASQADVDLPEMVPAPHSMPGKIAEIVSEVGLPYAGALKLAKAARIAEGLQKSKALAELSKVAPNLASWITRNVNYYVAGAAPDILERPFKRDDDGNRIINPGLADTMQEYGLLPTFLRFLATDADDPEFLARMKRVLAGFMVGGAVDTVVYGLRLAKRGLRASLNNDPELVINAVGKAQDARVKELVKRGLSKDAAEKVVYGEATGKALGVLEGDVRLPSPEDARFFDKMAEVTGNRDARQILDMIYSQSAELIESSRRRMTLEQMAEEGRELLDRKIVDVSDILDDLPAGAGLAHLDFHRGLKTILSDAGEYGELFERLREFGTRVRVAGHQYHGNPNARAGFYAKDNTIAIYDRAVIGVDLSDPKEVLRLRRTIAHEAIHSVLANTIRKNPEVAAAFRSKIEAWYKSIPLDKADEITRKKLQTIESNFAEAATYAFTDEKVARFLHSIEVVGADGSKQTLWQRLREIILGALDLKRTKLTELQDILDEFVGIEVKRATPEVSQTEVQRALSAFGKALRTRPEDIAQRIKGMLTNVDVTKDLPRTVVAAHMLTTRWVDETARVARAAFDSGDPAQMATAFLQIQKAGEVMSSLLAMRRGVGQGLKAHDPRTWSKFKPQDGVTANVVDQVEDVTGMSVVELRDKLGAFLAQHEKGEGLRGAVMATKFPWLKGALAYSQANILWSSWTHVANIVGGISATAEFVATRLFAGLRMRDIEVVKTTFAGMLYGFHEAFRFVDAFRARGEGELFKVEQLGRAWQALWTGRSTFGNAKDAVVPLGSTVGGRMPMLKLILSLPFHGLVSADDGFKSILYFGQLWEEGLLKARMANKPFSEYMGEFLSQVPADSHHRALAVATEYTLQESLRTAPNLARAIDSLQNNRLGLIVRILAAPFIQTPINLVRFTARRLPGAHLYSQRVIDDLAAGGLRRQQAVASQVLGTAALCGTFAWAWTGNVTGGVPRGQDDLWRAEGRQPFSIKIPGTNKWISYNRIEPLGMLMGMAANMARFSEMMVNKVKSAGTSMSQYEEEAGELIYAGLAILHEPLLSKTFTQSLGQLISALTNPEVTGWRTVSRILSQQVDKFIPMSSLPRNWQWDTSALKEYWSAWDLFWAKIDADKGLVDRRNVFTGERLERMGTPLAPISQESVNKIYKTLRELGVSPKPFPKRIIRSQKFMEGRFDFQSLSENMEVDSDYIWGDDAEGRKLYTRLWDIYEQNYGGEVMRALEQIVDNPKFKRIIDPAIKRRILNRVIARGRALAVKQFLREQEGVKESFKAQFRRQAAAIKGLYLDGNPGALEEAGMTYQDLEQGGLGVE